MITIILSPLIHYTYIYLAFLSSPSLFCIPPQPQDFDPPVTATPTRASAGLPARGDGTQGFVFVSFNRNNKIEPQVWKLWMEIMDRTPGSVLWLIVRKLVRCSHICMHINTDHCSYIDIDIVMSSL